jgi:hypothetical protein
MYLCLFDPKGYGLRIQFKNFDLFFNIQVNSNGHFYESADPEARQKP